MGGCSMDLMQGIRRPWSSHEAGLVGLTFLMLVFDAVTTIILFRSGAIESGFLETNIVVDMMHRNVVLGVLSYNLQWGVLILFFRPMRRIEYSLMILHLLSSGIAVVDNVTIYFFGKTCLTTFFTQLGVGKEHILFVALISYLAYTFHSMYVEDNRSFLKEFLKTLCGILFALVLEFIMLFVWIRYLYTCFW